MKTTLTISNEVALIAYDAITASPLLEEKLINEFPNIWIIETDDNDEHEMLFDRIIYEFIECGIFDDEFTINTEI